MMKFNELTLKLVCTNILSQNMDKKIIFIAFNLHGSRYFLHGLNIRVLKMQHFVCHAFSLISYLGILCNVYSL